MHKKLTFAAVLTLAGITAFAAPPVPDFRPQPGSEFGTVLRSTPITQRQQITTPRQTCVTEQVAVNNGQQGNTTNAVLGALLGAGLGTQIGGGKGNVAATAAGSVIGAEIGRNSGTQMYGSGTQMRDVQRCTTDNQIEHRDAVIGYDVVYEYAGIRYVTQLSREPGATIALQVTPR